MKTVCIEMNDEGQFRVYEEGAESGAEGGPEMMGMAPEAATGMDEGMEKDALGVVASLDEALAMAAQMLAGPQDSPEDSMMKGYNKGARPMNSAPKPGAVFGESM